MKLLASLLLASRSGVAVRPDAVTVTSVVGSLSASRNSSKGEGSPEHVIASVLGQTSNADARLALVGKQLVQMFASGPEAEGEFNSLADTLRDVLDKLLEEAKAMTAIAQASAQKEADAFEDCHLLEPHFQNFDADLKDHAQCRQGANTLKITADACNGQKAALKDTMDLVCQAFEDYKVADHSCPTRGVGESTEDWLLKAKTEFASRYDTYGNKKKACEDSTAAHAAVDCAPANSAYDTKEEACDVSYIRLETHSCDHATAAGQLSVDYETCYNNKKTQYEDRDAEMELEKQRELNSRLSMRMTCLVDSIKEDADKNTFTIDEVAFQKCADTREYDSTHLAVVWPPTPPKNPPAVPTAYPCNAEYLQRVNDQLPAFADLPECTECAGMAGWGSGRVLLMKLKAGSDRFRYDASYWTDTSVWNEAEGVKYDNSDDADVKTAAFNTQALKQVEVCYRTLENCFEYDLGQEFASAHALFSSGWIHSANLGQGSATPDEAKKAWTDLFHPQGDALYNTFWSGGSGNGCNMQRPGINTQCKDNNWARIGYCTNVPGQPCQPSDSNDADSPVGIGLKTQNWPNNVNAPFGNYFLHGHSTARFQAQAWLFAKGSLAPPPPPQDTGNLIMKLKAGSSEFRYEASYWTDESVFNEDTGPAVDADDIDAKLPAFNSKALRRLRVCYRALTNCFTYDLGQDFASARALFSGGFIRSENLGQGSATADEAKKAWTDVFHPQGDALYNTFWNGGSGNGCKMQRPGINTQCKDNNWARIGYCTNVPGQACQQSDSNDADSPVGIGLKTQNWPNNVNAPFGNYFLHGHSTARFQAQAWLFALQ